MLTGLIEGMADDDPSWEATWDRILSEGEHSNDGMASLVGLAWKHGKRELSRALLPKAWNASSSYKDLQVERVIQAQITAGDLSGAYLSSREIPKARRSYWIRCLVEECARVGALSGGMDLLMAIPVGLNERTQVAERLLCILADNVAG